MKYSNTSKQFYPEDVPYNLSTLPSDLVQVSAEDFKKAMSRKPSETLDYQGGQLIIVPAPAPTLDDLKNNNITDLTNACAATITGGYTSDALGSTHTYPSKPADQANMVASVTSSLLPNLPSGWSTKFWCCDSNGNWAFVPHNASQIQQAGSDGKVFIQSQQAQLEKLKSQVNNATSSTDLPISWTPA